MKRIQKLVSMLEFQSKVNDMNKTLKKVTNGDIVDGHYTIPDGVTKIGDYAFYECISLERVIIPESVTEIGEGAFCGCKNLKNIIIPESVSEIGEYAFYGCTSLSNIIIPESVSEIGEGAFDWCKNLKKISLPKRVKLGNDVFFKCNSDLKIEDRD